MKRLVTWMVVGSVIALGAFWAFPATRVVLNIVPPARNAIDTLMPVKTADQAPIAKGKGRAGPPPVPVTVAAVVIGDMAIILSAPGTVEAQATVAVKSRVDGQIAEVLFKEGDLVKKDQILFRLDDRLILAQIRQAEANINRDRANLAEAEATLERRNILMQKRIASEAAVDTAKALVQVLKAAIASGQAALEGQRTLLDYLVIRSPLDGRTGATQVNPGSNIRAADTNPLVVINQIRPISVAFSLPQTHLDALRRALKDGAMADVTVAGTKPTIRQGQLAFIDNQVDKQTGALAAKVLVPNDDEALWPGQAVEVALNVEVRRNMLSVPASAVLPSQQGMIVWVVNGDNRVAPRTVVLDRIVGQTAYLADGVKPGEVVVTDGHVRLAPNGLVVVRDPSAPKGPSDMKKNEKGKGNGEKRS